MVNCLLNFLIIYFLQLLVLIQHVKGNHYGIKLNSDLVSRGYFLKSYSKQFYFQCLAECNKYADCTLSVYDRGKTTNENNCFLYSSYFDSSKLIQSDFVDIYIRRDGIVTPRFMEIFKNFQNSSLREQKYVASGGIRNFDTYVLNNKTYYCIMRSSLTIMVYDENWNYITTHTRTSQTLFMKIVDNADIYLSTITKIQKTDTALNLLKESISAVSGYRQLCYDKKTNQIYGTNVGSNRIDIFDRDLNLLDTINTGKSNHGVAIFNDILYIGANTGYLIAYQYKTLIYEIKTNCTDFIYSVTIDDYGHISLACESFGFLLYDKNGTYLNYNISLINARYLNFDSKLQGIVLDNMNLNIIKNLY